LLSAVVLPMLLSTVFFASTQRFDRHKRLARKTYPVWLYVSVTGVVVYFFLRGYY
jgi:putative membrane protein